MPPPKLDPLRLAVEFVFLALALYFGTIGLEVLAWWIGGAK